MTIVVAVRQYPTRDVAGLVAALSSQANQVADAWGLRDDIAVVAYHGRKPPGSWRMQFYAQLPPGMGGVHLDNARGLPYAKILADSEWSVAASHEFCEMLIDPQGDRFEVTPNGAREVLVEVCDPVEADTPLVVGDVVLSPFVRPDYYRQPDPVGAIHEGGYISFIERHLWRQAFRRGGVLSIDTLGPAKLRSRAERDRLLKRRHLERLTRGSLLG